MAAGLGQAANRVDGGCPQPNQQLSCADQCETLLLFDGAVGDRPEDVRIETSVACLLLGIHLIALTITMRDSPQFAHVGHDHFVPKLLQLLANERWSGLCLWQTHPAHDVLESWIQANRIEPLIRENPAVHRPFLVRRFEPLQCRVALTEALINDGDVLGWDVPSLRHL
jgi:hypothetical protein